MSRAEKAEEKPAIERIINLLTQRTKNLRSYSNNPAMQNRANEADTILKYATDFYKEETKIKENEDN